MEPGSVTKWIEQMRDGDRDVIHALVKRYFTKLGDVARGRLQKRSQNLHDEEDVANFVLEAVTRNIAKGRYPDLQDRDDLWFLMLAITQRRISNILKLENRSKSKPSNLTSLTELLETYEGDLSDLSSDSEAEHVALEIGDCWQELMRLLPNDGYREIARLKLDFYSNRQISDKINMSPRFVDRRVADIQRLWSEIYHV